jgi:hypothetical protein
MIIRKIASTRSVWCDDTIYDRGTRGQRRYLWAARQGYGRGTCRNGRMVNRASDHAAPRQRPAARSVTPPTIHDIDLHITTNLLVHRWFRITIRVSISFTLNGVLRCVANIDGLYIFKCSFALLRILYFLRQFLKHVYEYLL